MAKDLVWTNIMLREFESLVPLNAEQLIVLHDMVRDESVVKTALSHNMSTRKVDDIRRQIREKYDAVQPFTPLLPKRKIK